MMRHGGHEMRSSLMFSAVAGTQPFIICNGTIYHARPKKLLVSWTHCVPAWASFWEGAVRACVVVWLVFCIAILICNSILMYMDYIRKHIRIVKPLLIDWPGTDFKWSIYGSARIRELEYRYNGIAWAIMCDPNKVIDLWKWLIDWNWSVRQFLLYLPIHTHIYAYIYIYAQYSL